MNHSKSVNQMEGSSIQVTAKTWHKWAHTESPW